MPQNTISSLRCSCQEFRFRFPRICDTSEYALLFSVLVHAKGGLCTLQVKYQKYVLVKCTVYRNTEYLMADRIFETFYNQHKHIFITDHSVSCNSSSQIFIELSSITCCPYFSLFFHLLMYLEIKILGMNTLSVWIWTSPTAFPDSESKLHHCFQLLLRSSDVCNRVYYTQSLSSNVLQFHWTGFLLLLLYESHMPMWNFVLRWWSLWKYYGFQILLS